MSEQETRADHKNHEDPSEPRTWGSVHCQVKRERWWRWGKDLRSHGRSMSPAGCRGQKVHLCPSVPTAPWAETHTTPLQTIIKISWWWSCLEFVQFSPNHHTWQIKNTITYMSHSGQNLIHRMRYNYFSPGLKAILSLPSTSSNSSPTGPAFLWPPDPPHVFLPQYFPLWNICPCHALTEVHPSSEHGQVPTHACHPFWLLWSSFASQSAYLAELPS